MTTFVIKAFVLVLVTSIGLSGCQMFSTTEETVVDPNRLESLSPADLDPALSRFTERPELDVDVVIESYEQLLPLLVEPEEQITVLQRLADLKLVRGEELMAEQAIDELDIAVQAYQGLLARYPNRASNDAVLYQLARSYDLQGNTDAYYTTLSALVAAHPDSQHIAESHFRRGEIYFSDGEYSKAEQAFQSVVEQGDTPFLANAHYMKGWSEFKQTRYQDGLTSFIAVLDLFIPEEDFAVRMASGNVVTRNEAMVNDLFRVMGLSFSYLGGADALEELFARTGPRHYEILIYDQYSDLLLEKEQFTDAIEVYRRFIDLHPLDVHAPRYQIQIVETLRQGGFITGIVDEKIRFVERYGMGTQFWLAHQNGDLGFVKTQLKSLLPELADRQYVLANKAQETGDAQSARKHFGEAAKYYQGYIDTFPQANDLAEIWVLLAECQLGQSLWQEAIASFEVAAYDYPSYDGAAEAGYASILAHIEFESVWGEFEPEAQEVYRLLQQESRLRFVNVHADDSRADNVLYSAILFHFNREEYVSTIDLSQRLINWQPMAEPNLAQEAQIILAHAYFANLDFVNAERAYATAIAGLSPKDKRVGELTENLAASVYRQAEAFVQAGDKSAAIGEFLRVAQVAPQSSLRPNAEYDAIGFMIELGQWKPAINQILDFRARYPRYELLGELVPIMALAYRETKQWELAGDELKVMLESAETEQEKQDTLFIAAELYDRAESTQKAIVTYRRYANTYPDPADVYMEAANRLAELYDKTDDQSKRRFWLKKQMSRVDSLGSEADERMVYLAASASTVLADDAFRKYAAIKLKQPLQASMEKKTVALEAAMKAYQKTASYGISSFSTEAGYRMADIYAQLSRDLMDSDRPDGLNELELEQYEILLEEQAFPFEDDAIDIHEQNVSRSWDGIYDEWIKRSFESLRVLLPGRYDKPEMLGGLLNAN